MRRIGFETLHPIAQHRPIYTQIARRLHVTNATLLDQLHSFKFPRVNLDRSMTQLRLPSETSSSPISPINVCTQN